MRIAAPLMLALLAGCSAGPDYHSASIGLPTGYTARTPIAAADPRWWQGFGDPLLDRLVEQALAQNLDIAAAAARIDQARAAARGADAALLPSVDATGSVDRNRVSTRTPVGAVATGLGLPRDYTLYQLGGQASWELDLFGGLRRGREAARADRDASLADAAGVRLAVAAETVDAYCQLRGLQAQRDVAARQLAAEEKLRDLVRRRFVEGLVAEREYNRVAGEAQGLAAAIAPIDAGIVAQINRLAVLVGRPAGGDPDGLAVMAAIPRAPDPAGSAIPADLLRRRPDLAAAERRVAAADARVGAALADHYPRITLRALIGVASLGTGNLFTGGAVQALAGGGFRWRLFDFGRVDAEVAAARGREREVLARYRGTALRATEEVETALVRLGQARREITLREAEVATLMRAREQARIGYAGGVLALIDVLDADRSMLASEDRLVLARAEAARASVAAARALGGGWAA